jgi:hypothetical protein
MMPRRERPRRRRRDSGCCTTCTTSTCSQMAVSRSTPCGRLLRHTRQWSHVKRLGLGEGVGLGVVVLEMLLLLRIRQTHQLQQQLASEACWFSRLSTTNAATVTKTATKTATTMTTSASTTLIDQKVKLNTTTITVPTSMTTMNTGAQERRLQTWALVAVATVVEVVPLLLLQRRCWTSTCNSSTM